MQVGLSDEKSGPGDFKRNSAEFLKQMRDGGHPMVLTINGKAEIVVQDAVSYQGLLDYVEQLEALKGIQLGLADVEAERTTHPSRGANLPAAPGIG
jgi:Antitoxin Phd_YefM, type II toxin-antitoxin system